MAKNFAELFPRGNTNTVTELDTKPTTDLQRGYDFSITHQWDGKPITEHAPIKLSMKWHFQRQPGRPHKRVIRVHIKAPLIDEDESPGDGGGIRPELWNYEVVELFFANEKGHYTEVEVGPHGHWLVLLHNGFRQCFNKGEDIELQVANEWKGSEWNCQLEIPLAYLPGRITKFNAYAIHGLGPDRHYEALYAVTDGTVKEPDFHRLEYFGKIESRRLIPEGYNRAPFNDMRYGNMWEAALKETTE